MRIYLQYTNNIAHGEKSDVNSLRLYIEREKINNNRLFIMMSTKMNEVEKYSR